MFDSIFFLFRNFFVFALASMRLAYMNQQLFFFIHSSNQSIFPFFICCDVADIFLFCRSWNFRRRIWIVKWIALSKCCEWALQCYNILLQYASTCDSQLVLCVLICVASMVWRIYLLHFEKENIWNSSKMKNLYNSIHESTPSWILDFGLIETNVSWSF